MTVGHRHQLRLARPRPDFHVAVTAHERDGRYICKDPDCTHRDCPPRRRADEDHLRFGVP
jgi:hypothetical protein